MTEELLEVGGGVTKRTNKIYITKSLIPWNDQIQRRP